MHLIYNKQRGENYILYFVTVCIFDVSLISGVFVALALAMYFCIGGIFWFSMVRYLIFSELYVGQKFIELE